MTKREKASSLESITLQSLGLDTFISIDLETTGLDSRSDRIIEIGAVRFEGGKPSEEYHSFVNPDRLLDPFITDLTGIQDSDLKNAPGFLEISHELRDFTAEWPLVGQNIDFDLSFLKEAGEAVRGRSRRNPFLFAERYFCDTAFLGRVFWPELPSFSLASLTEFFEIEIGRHHRAVDDARAAGSLLVRMIDHLPRRVWKDLADKLTALINGTNHRNRHFFAYLQKASKNKKAAVKESATEDLQREEEKLSTVEEYLDKDGRFEKRFDFFRHRAMQIEMAREVESALEQNRVLLIEAPTGTGKSLAYLLPALLWTARDPSEQRQVIVSSRTKTLQSQLFEKDVREIREVFGAEFKAAVLKGKKNYLDKSRLNRLIKEADEYLSDYDRIQLMPLVRWSEITATGDISEISAFDPVRNAYLWSLVSSDPAVKDKKGDFHRAAQKCAAESQLVFVNHALLMSDLDRLTAKPDGMCKVIIDEAHHIEAAIVSSLTTEVNPSLLRSALLPVCDEKAERGLLLRLRKSLDRSQTEKLELERRIQDLTVLHAELRQRFADLAETTSAMIEGESRPAKFRFRSADRLHTEICRFLEPLAAQWSGCFRSVEDTLTAIQQLDPEERPPQTTLNELRSAADQLEEQGKRLRKVLQVDDENLVRWVEAGRGLRGSWCSIYSAPVSVGNLMENSFWPVLDTAVLTSATMSTGGNFNHLRGTLGISEREESRVREVILESPFSLECRMKLTVPVFLPKPSANSPVHSDELAAIIAHLMETEHRGTLVLCTSNDMVDRLSAALVPAAKKFSRQLLHQRRGESPHRLLERFKKHKTAILLGTASLWEGIDVAGEALQILIIAKLPFEVPTDPWFEARCEALSAEGINPFQDYTVPAAVIRLKQGIGRLIRRPDDYGVVILADPRVVRSSYGEYIRRSLPVVPQVSRSMEELLETVSSFFKNKRR